MNVLGSELTKEQFALLLEYADRNKKIMGKDNAVKIAEKFSKR